MLRLMVLCIVSMLPSFAIEHIKNYELFIKQYEENGRLFLISRRFMVENRTFYVSTNTQTLQTDVVNLESSKLSDLNETFYSSPFGSYLNNATSLHVKGGISHATTASPKAIYLTMDLCPSSKGGYERAFLEELIKKNGKTPIAIAITSSWMSHHSDAFEELLHNPSLEITWVNHSHTHFYDPHLKDHENFMTHPSTNLQTEILGLEKKLLEEGVTPSIFFRFPGLVANESLMKALRERYFLIPLSADAWIAKNEPIKEGSFILIHGNKNEPLGIEILQKKLPEVLKMYHFSPLQKAFIP